MTYKTFFNALAFRFVTEPEFQGTADLAGIDWFKCPPIESTKMVWEYLEERSRSSHKVAFEKVRVAAQMYAGDTLEYRVPGDHSELSDELVRHLRAADFDELGKSLQHNPYQGNFILDQFVPGETVGIKSASVSDLLPIVIAEHLEKVKSKEAVVTIPTFEMLSEIKGGFNSGRVDFLMADTGVGKTNILSNLALAAAGKYVVGFVNMELSYEDIVSRFYCISTGTDYREYRRGRLECSAVEDLQRLLADRLHVTNGRSLSVAAIEAWARKLSKQGLKFLMIDYDQKIDLPYERNTPEWMAIKKAVCRIEDLAKELNFYCLIAVQQNREGEISSSRRATFSAHTVLSFETHEKGHVIVARKNRHGDRNAAVLVDYCRRTSRILEREILEITEVENSPQVRRLRRPPSGSNRHVSNHQRVGANHD